MGQPRAICLQTAGRCVHLSAIQQARPHRHSRAQAHSLFPVIWTTAPRSTRRCATSVPDRRRDQPRDGTRHALHPDTDGGYSPTKRRFRARHAQFLRELGADDYIDYTTTAIESVARDVDVVFDTVGEQHGERLLKVLKRGGRLIPINLGNFSAEHAAAAGVTIGTSHHQPLRSNGAQLAEIGGLIDTGCLRVAIDTIVPLAEARTAHERGERGHVRGKIVLLVVE